MTRIPGPACAYTEQVLQKETTIFVFANVFEHKRYKLMWDKKWQTSVLWFKCASFPICNRPLKAEGLNGRGGYSGQKGTEVK